MPKIGAPSARYGATAVWTGREALVFGGVSFTDGDIYRSDGAAFRP